MSHRHYCDFAGHDWQCSGNCECICGLLMEGNDHSDCPVELRACPEHADEQQRSIEEAMSSEPDPALVQKWRERPSCECDCGEAELNKVVGWSFHILNGAAIHADPAGCGRGCAANFPKGFHSLAPVRR